MESVFMCSNCNKETTHVVVKKEPSSRLDRFMVRGHCEVCGQDERWEDFVVPLTKKS